MSLDLKKIEAAINQISAEKKIEKAKLLEIIEHAIKTAYKKDFGSKDSDVNVRIDFEEPRIEITVDKVIVEHVENQNTEISLEELGEDAENFSIGDTVEIDVSDEVLESEE